MKRKQKKLWAAFLLAAVVLIVPVGATVYGSMKKNDIVHNNLQIGDLRVEIDEEDFEDELSFDVDKTYKKVVKIELMGDKESDNTCFVRVMALPIITATKSDGTVVLLPATTSGSSPVLSVDYNTTTWKEGGDGYFYYLKKLVKNETVNLDDHLSDPLFHSVRLNSANLSSDYTDAKLTFEVKAEAINTTKHAYRTAWWGGEQPTVSPLKEVEEALEPQAIGE